MLDKNYLRYHILVAVLLGLQTVSAQDSLSYDSIAARYADLIDTNRVKEHLIRLASIDFQGRETAQAGQRMAADYIQSHFKSIGLTPMVDDSSFVQFYTLYETRLNSGHTILDRDTLRILEDFYTFSALVDTTIKFSEVEFLGYGIADDVYDNYGAKDMKGKAALIYHGEPMRDDKSLISNTVMPTLWSDGYEAKIEVAKARGVSVLFVVQEAFVKNLPRVTYYMQRPKLLLAEPGNEALPIVFIGPDEVSTLFPEYGGALIHQALLSNEAAFDISRSGEMSFTLKKDVEKVQSSNLIGCVKGNSLPDEYVFLSAHYDHLGMKDSLIYFGADDNGSGTSALLEMARIFAQARSEGNGPERSVVFLLVSGEEKGLLGSEYYVDNPVVPLNNTVVDLNVDMIGRTDKALEGKDSNYIYLIGSDKLSTQLHELSEDMNSMYSNLRLDYKYNDPNDPQRLYYRSDHYNFAKHKIPVIFYFRGLHDDYHKPTDTVDKIEFETIRKVSNLIFHTTWAVANRAQKITVDEELK